MTVHARQNRRNTTVRFEGDSVAPTILDALAVGVLLVNSRGNVLFRNNRAESWIGQGATLEAILGDARFPAAFEGWEALLERVARTGEPSSVDCALEGSNPARPALLTLHCSRPADTIQNVPAAVVITMQPCTQSQAAEERLEVAHRLLSLGKLAAQVAHELNNPLDGILRYINLALRLSNDAQEPKLRSYLAESRTGLIRMVQIIGDLLEYSRTSSGEFDAMSINEVVEQAIRNTTSARGTGKVLIAADFQEDKMPVVGGSRLYQVCCNLIKNALDAMPDGGRLSITTGLVGGDIIIRFTDSGVGLPKDVENLFRPFFTTKEPGKGTGLGLAICKEFVEAMQGSVTAAHGPSGGAVFTVRIPERSCRRPARLADRTTNEIRQ